jgi:hypothetical protein
MKSEYIKISSTMQPIKTINNFLPISVLYFRDYLIKTFNIDINNIPLEDWNNLIYKNYCKNIINNKFCLKKIKKIGKDICSKCCEKKGLIKYKKTKIKKSKKDKEPNSDDEGFYTGTDNETTTNKRSLNIEESINKNDLLFNIDISKKDEFIKNRNLKLDNNLNSINNSKYMYFGDLKVNIDGYEIDNLFSKNNINIVNNYNNYVNNCNGYIMFGSLEVEIQKDKNKDISLEVISSNENKICNIEFKKRILTKTKIIKYFNKLYLEIKNKKNNNFMNNINEDLYYVFLYSINLIFKNEDINLIRKEISNCLGELGISYFINQFNTFLNNDILS